MSQKLITFIEATSHQEYRMVSEPIEKRLKEKGFSTEVIFPDKKEVPNNESKLIITNYFWALEKLKEIYDLKKNTIAYVAHGISPWKFFDIGYESCDYVFLSSEFERDKMFESGGKNPDDSKIITTGWSKLDLLNDKIKDKDEIRSSIVKKLKLKKNKPIIVYLPTFTHRDKANIAGSVLSLDEIEPSQIDNFIIGIHFFDKTKKDVKETLSKFKHIWDEPNKYDLMIAADVIVGDISSIMIEALLLDVPIIHLMNQNNSLSIYETDKYGECILGDICREPENLIQIIKENLKEDRNKQTREEWKEKLIYNPGQATEAIVDQIVKVLNEQ